MPTISIVAPQEGTEFPGQLSTVEIEVTINVAEEFDGHWQYRLNETFSEDGLGNGTAINSGVKANVPVYSDTEFTVYVALVDSGDKLIRQEPSGGVKFNVLEVDTDLDGIGDSIDAFPTDNTKYKSELDVITPTNNQVFEWNTTQVTVNIEAITYKKFKGHWQYKLNDPFPTEGPGYGVSIEETNTAYITVPEMDKNYTVYITLVDEDTNVLDPELTYRRDYYVKKKDIDFDGVPDLDDAFPTDNTKSTANLEVVYPKPNSRFELGTEFVEIKIKEHVAPSFTGKWAYKYGDPFPTSGAAGGYQVEFGTLVSKEVTVNVPYQFHATLVDLQGNVITPNVTAYTHFSVRPPDSDDDGYLNDVDAFPEDPTRYLPEIEIKVPTKNQFV